MPQISEAKGDADMIDMNKKYQTKDGKPVRIYSTDGCEPRPIHGEYLGDNAWRQASWREEDLVEVHETVVTWRNVYETTYDSREIADRCAAEDRVAVVRVERTGDKVQCFVEEVFAQ